jgi:hypothetical protein
VAKLIRRLIIIIALFLIYPNIFMMFDLFERDIPKEIIKQVENGHATMIDLDEEVSIGEDNIEFKHLILSESETLLIYEVHKKEQGWSFPHGALELMDQQGENYKISGSSSSGKSWGEFIITHYEALPNGVNEIVIDFDWYDRTFQTEFSLKQEEL